MKDVNVGLLEAMKELGQLLGKSEEIDPIVEKGFIYLKNKKSAKESVERKKIIFKGKSVTAK